MTSFEQNRPSTRATRKPGRRHTARSAPRVQAALGWAALALVLWATLRNGGTPMPVWHLVYLATLALFAVQAVLDLRFGLPRQARMALWVALPYLAVLVWLQIQSMSGLAPGLAHPFWAGAPEGAQAAISAHPDAGQHVVMRLSCYALLFWIFLRSAETAKRGGIAFIRAIAIFSTALAIYGLVSQATGFNFLLDAEETGSVVRASFWNRNAYATFAVFGVLANVTVYLRSVSGSDGGEGLIALRDFLEAFFAGGWLYAFGALVGLVAVAMTLSRAGAMAGVTGMIVLLWALRRGQGKSSSALLAIPVALFAFVALFMTSGVIDRMESVDDGARFAVYRQVVEGIADRPLLGHGAGAFPEAFRGYAPAKFAYVDWQRAHNSYLENAFEFGLPAAALFYLGLALVGWRLVRGVLTRRRNQAIPAFALACFAAAFVHAAFEFTLQVPSVAALFACILGIGWAQSFPTRKPV